VVVVAALVVVVVVVVVVAVAVYTHTHTQSGQVGQKPNYVQARTMLSIRKACDMSNVFKFFLKKMCHICLFAYSLLICTNL